MPANTVGSWNTYYTSATLAVITTALNQINSNCGWPNAQCQTWTTITQSYNETFYFILMPPPGGYVYPNGDVITQATMIANVVGVTQQQSDPSWWPPIIPPEMKEKAVIVRKQLLDMKDVKVGLKKVLTNYKTIEEPEDPLDLPATESPEVDVESPVMVPIETDFGDVDKGDYKEEATAESDKGWLKWLL